MKKKKEKTPPTRMEKISIGIAVAALVVSVSGVLLTSPIILERYQKPNLELAAFMPATSDTQLLSRFKMDNTGHSMATGITITFWCLPKDRIDISSGGNYGMSPETVVDTMLFRDSLMVEVRTVNIRRMPERGSALISIFSDLAEATVARDKLMNNENPFARYVRVPNINSIIYDQGEATIDYNLKVPEITDSALVY